MAGKPYLDGVGVNVFGDWVKNKIEQSLGEGSLDLAVPQVKIEYPDSGDHAVVTLETNYDLVSSGVVVVGYTTDGTTPEVTSTEFHSPMDLYKNGTLTLRAFLALTAEQMIPSVANAVNISGLKCQRPTYTYNDDTYQFTLACATPEANIRYTTNGSEPTDSSALYSGPVTVSESCTVKAKAFLDGIDASETLSFEASVAKVFGVEWNYGQSSPALTRLQPTTDPLHLVTELISSEPSPATSASSGGSSPFDAYNPWAGMRRRNFLADGTPGPWEDEPGFSTTSYDTMVWIPKFWIKVVDDSSAKLRKYYIADNNAEGFTLHPGSGQYIGAYPTSNSKESKGGKSRTGSQSIVTMRSNAKTKGAGWGLIDIAQRSAIQFLYLITMFQQIVIITRAM